MIGEEDVRSSVYSHGTLFISRASSIRSRYKTPKTLMELIQIPLASMLQWHYFFYLLPWTTPDALFFARERFRTSPFLRSSPAPVSDESFHNRVGAGYPFRTFRSRRCVLQKLSEWASGQSLVTPQGTSNSPSTLG